MFTVWLNTTAVNLQPKKIHTFGLLNVPIQPFFYSSSHFNSHSTSSPTMGKFHCICLNYPTNTMKEIQSIVWQGDIFRFQIHQRNVSPQNSSHGFTYINI